MADVNSEKDFFISYTKADQHWAEWIAWQLEKAEYTTIIQLWDFQPGTNIALNMHYASINSKRTIAVLSHDYFESDFTPSEWAAAFIKDPKSEKAKLVPVRVRECNPEGILTTIVYIDIVGLSEDDAVKALLDGVNTSNRPKPKPNFPGPPNKPKFPGQPLTEGKNSLNNINARQDSSPEETAKHVIRGESFPRCRRDRAWVWYKGRNLMWLLYISPAIIGLLGIILFFTVVPSTLGKTIPLNAILTGDINKIINSIGTSFSSVNLIFLRVLFYIIFVAFVTSLFFAGRQLQKKKEPDSLGAILRGKDAYFMTLDISQNISEAKRKMNNQEVTKAWEKIKRIEEQLKFESDFGCGDNLVTECENNIAAKLNELKDSVNRISKGEQLYEQLQNIEQIAMNLKFLLKRRREITKK